MTSRQDCPCGEDLRPSVGVRPLGGGGRSGKMQADPRPLRRPRPRATGRPMRADEHDTSGARASCGPAHWWPVAEPESATTQSGEELIATGSLAMHTQGCATRRTTAAQVAPALVLFKSSAAPSNVSNGAVQGNPCGLGRSRSRARSGPSQ